MNLRNTLLAGAFVLVAVIAAIGWARNTSPGPAAAYSQDTANGAVTPVANGAVTPLANGGYYQAPVDSGAGQGSAGGYVSLIPRPVVIRQPEAVYAAGAPPSETRAEHHERSTGKSVAIVAGSTGAGAAIGALAGGGKGAGIGALAGGVGGFIYDRVTHNH